MQLGGISLLLTNLVLSKRAFLNFLFQTKLLRQCLGHVDACRVLRKKIGIGGLNSSLKGDKNIFLCSLSTFLPND